MASSNIQVREGRRSLTQQHARNVVLLGKERAKVGVAQTRVQSDVGPNLPAVLNEGAEEVLALVGAIASRKASDAVKATVLDRGRIVEEVPDVVEVVARPASW